MAMNAGEWSFLVFIALMLVFSVTSNILVAIVVWKIKKLRNVTNILICNLALSDVILGGFILPQNLHDLSHEDNYHEGLFLCKVANACPLWCITCSIYTMVIISYERKRSIVDSFSAQISVRYCKIIIPILWIFATLVVIPTLIEFEVYSIFQEGDNSTYLSCGTYFFPRVLSVANGIFLLLISYVIPLIILSYNYSKIIRFVWKKSKEVNPSTNQQPRIALPSVLLKKRIQIIKMLIIVAILFVISWLPYFLSLVIAKVWSTDNSENASSFISMLKMFLAGFSTAYNVVVYVIFNVNFRNGFKQILFCFSPKKIKCTATPSPVAAQKISPSPAAAQRTSPSPVAAQKTSPSHFEPQSTSPSPVATQWTPSSPVAVHRTSPSHVVAQRTSTSHFEPQSTSPSPVATQWTPSSPVAAHRTSPSHVVAQRTSPSPVAAHRTSPSHVVAQRNDEF